MPGNQHQQGVGVPPLHGEVLDARRVHQAPNGVAAGVEQGSLIRHVDRVGGAAHLEREVDPPRLRHLQPDSRPGQRLEPLELHLHPVHPRLQQRDEVVPNIVRFHFTPDAGGFVDNRDDDVGDHRSGGVPHRPVELRRGLRVDFDCHERRQPQNRGRANDPLLVHGSLPPLPEVTGQAEPVYTGRSRRATERKLNCHELPEN